MKNYKQTATDVLRLVGGEKNVAQLEHCSTRLRFTLADPAKADVAALKKTPGVMGVIASGPQCQVVIGNDVIEVYDELTKLGSFHASTGAPASAGKKSISATALDLMVGIFQPLVPAIAGGGILKAFLSLFALVGWIDSAGVLYRTLIAVADAPLYYLPLMVAVTMAIKINCNKLVALATVGALLLPATSTLISEGNSLFGIPIQNVTYAYQVFPAILAVAFLYFLEKYITKITPKPIRVFFVPMVCFIITFPITLLLLGPLGLTIGKGITTVMLAIYSKVGWLAVGLVAAILPLLISVGAHKAFIPYVVTSLGDLGYEILYNGASLAHNISEGGASLAVALKTKNSELRSTAISSGVSAIFGITEPAIYSITLQKRRVLFGVMIGSFISGSFIGLMAVKAFVAMGPGLAGMAMFVDPENAMNIVWAFVGFGLSLVGSFLATLILYKDEETAETVGQMSAETAVPAAATAENNVVYSPLQGKAISITEVKDEVFSQKILGDGMAVVPVKGELYAPADGRIESVFEARHAVSMVTSQGAELLMHIGMDTVKLEGKYFEPQVQDGDTVKKGQLLMKFDLDAIKAAGYDVTTPVVVTNSDRFAVKPAADGMVVPGAALIKLEVLK
ncbi:beta-glucoside-specific PTS transporter subunit IIABC [Agathobaculum sp. Marseille-P7918]|uniref:beta-glucoside-specific PTS transporter subunit IIABC n=1 Tax=Agathobaculum sp. Marseille-P7918 TaxID=2479843 RepID=UPI00356A7DFF